jgi:hypothetical protein
MFRSQYQSYLNYLNNKQVDGTDILDILVSEELLAKLFNFLERRKTNINGPAVEPERR